MSLHSEHELMNIHNDRCYFAEHSEYPEVCKAAEFLIFAWKRDSAVGSKMQFSSNF